MLSVKRLVFRLAKELSELNNKKTTKEAEKWAKDPSGHFSKKDTQMAKHIQHHWSLERCKSPSP